MTPARGAADDTGDTGRPGASGLTLPVLAVAALVASPAIYQCLVNHTISTGVMLGRYVVIALVCAAVSAVVGRLAPGDVAAGDPGGASADRGPLPADPAASSRTGTTASAVRPVTVRDPAVAVPDGRT